MGNKDDRQANLYDLIERCRMNNRKAQLKLYNDYAGAMYRTAFRFLKREDLAQDAMQEGFIKAFRNLEAFNYESSFGAWLKRIVINVCLDKLKKNTLKTTELNEAVHILEVETDWTVEGDFTAAEIVAKIDELPPKYQMVLKLYLLEGYDHQEIAQILGISEGTSRSQLMRGKIRLKQLLTKKKAYENRHSGTS